MARNYARITTALWRDPEWTALSVDAQWAYVALLAQPKLTLAGSLDMKIQSWRRWAAGVDEARLTNALVELQDEGMILTDTRTQELVIRTFVLHDDVLKNRNLGRGMWSAWSTIESEELRLFVVDNLPDEAWEPRFEPPFLSRNNHGLNHRSNHESNLLQPATYNLQPQPQPTATTGSPDICGSKALGAVGK